MKKIILLAAFVWTVPPDIYAQDEQEEEVCLACSREAWEGDSAAVNKFIAECGVIDTVGYDSLDVVVEEKPVVKKVTMKLNSGKVLYTDSIYLVPDVMPEYKDGFEGMLAHLKQNVRYPAEAKNKKITGVVIVEFVVERDGSVKHARVTRGIGHGCDTEALRVVRAMLGWKPGARKGRNVRVQLNLPVRFAI